MDGLFHGDFVYRRLGAGFSRQSFALRHFQFRCQARLSPYLGELEGFFLALQVVPCHQKHLLVGAQINVSAGYIAEQGH